jgi:hypothetical protein
MLLEGTVDVTFDCPEARDADEPGGRFALYLAPLLDGDALGTVECAE